MEKIKKETMQSDWWPDSKEAKHFRRKSWNKRTLFPDLICQKTSAWEKSLPRRQTDVHVRCHTCFHRQMVETKKKRKEEKIRWKRFSPVNLAKSFDRDDITRLKIAEAFQLRMHLQSNELNLTLKREKRIKFLMKAVENVGNIKAGFLLLSKLFLRRY